MQEVAGAQSNFFTALLLHEETFGHFSEDSGGWATAEENKNPEHANIIDMKLPVVTIVSLVMVEPPQADWRWINRKKV